MKDETTGHPVYELIGLRPKMYSFKVIKVQHDNSLEFVEKHRAMGIQRAAAEKFRDEDYKSQLDNPEEKFVNNRRLCSRLHRIYGIEVHILHIVATAIIVHSRT